VDPLEVVESLERLHEVLDSRTRRRLAYRRRAATLGVASSRLLEFLDHLRLDLENRSNQCDPEVRLMEMEARRHATRVLALVGQLSEAEQRLLRLRFEENLTAKEIARALEIKDPKLVYRMTEQCLRRLRSWAKGMRTPARKRPGDVV
jgi:DNA-directed RNA polymerase specialized sigma subunit